MGRKRATLGIVEVNLGPEPHERHIARRLGGRSVLEIIVRRMTDCQRLDAVVVITADAAGQQQVANLVPTDVPVLVGEADDRLASFVSVARQYDVGAVVRVRANYPFVDPVLIDRLVTTAEGHPGCDYITYCSREGRPAMLSSLGVLAEWCSAAALRTAGTEATEAQDRDDPLRYVASHPERFSVRLLAIPDQLDRDDVRLCIHREEDWDFAQTIYDALGPERLDWQGIADLLSASPALRKRMAISNRAETAG